MKHAIGGQKGWGVALLCGVMGLSACTQDKDQNSQPSAITNRTTVIPEEKVILIRLSSDALLKHAGMSDRGAVIDPELKKQVILEQDDLIRRLKELSAQIRVLWRYKYVLNALAVVIPGSLEDTVRGLAGVQDTHADQPFGRPEAFLLNRPSSGNLAGETSVTFIGALKVRETLQVLDEQGRLIPVNGQGMKIGIVDTGIDYTHKMLGGSGNPLDYASISPDGDPGLFFPNRKVVGGIDLVGSDYNAASHDFSRHIPRPDQNPLDEGGHGTHVAGTVAGTGDGEHTYTGVAPGASLYAIKVFGKDGSTTDSVVIAALEYAVDPTGQDDPSGHLDVVNLSLGSSFGLPHILYDQAVSHLVRAGVTPVMSAGNSGDIPYIVGSPGASDAALSVAASVDNMDHNWKFQAVEFSFPGEDAQLVKAVEGSITTPVSESRGVRGALIPVGLVVDDLSEELRQRVRGQVALIDRGEVSFFHKLQKVFEAGAIGAVVVNNREGEPVPMGGSGMIPIPGIMIEKSLGMKIKDAVSEGKEVRISFDSDLVMEEPFLIDTVTEFSSRGPRSLDSAIKPEISAPGQQIISAKMGGGYQGVAMSGTSMAAPHMAGVVALLKQYRRNLSEDEVKSLIMNSGKILRKKDGTVFPVARQGAGRVQAFEALTGNLSTFPVSLSLGEHALETRKMLRRTITLKNHGEESLSLNLHSQISEGWELRVSPGTLTLLPGESSEVQVFAVIQAPVSIQEAGKELSGWIMLTAEGESRQWKIPVLGVVRKLSRLKAGVARIHGGSASDSDGAVVELTLKNQGRTSGEALLFNLLAKDDRKPGIGERGRHSDICDLESVGYRVIQSGAQGERAPVLQIAAKLFSPLTTWNHCEISVQFDGNGDGIADQELLGTELATLTDSAQVNEFFSVLTSAEEMRRIRREYDQNGGRQDYTPAFTDRQKLLVYQHGTLVVLSARLDRLSVTAPGLMRIKVASLVTSKVIGSGDDFLSDHGAGWQTVDPWPEMSPFYGFHEADLLLPGEERDVILTRGSGSGRMIAYFPHNLASLSSLNKDQQSQIIQNRYLY